jgi:tape measure domain-containing protein
MELDPVVQRFIWDSSQFDAGIQQSQQKLQAFQQAMARGAPLQRTLGQFPSVPAGERALRQLESSLGGAFRAAAQMRVAQERLDLAFRTGRIDAERYRALHEAMQRTFSAEAVSARDLRANMAGMNAAMAAGGRSMLLFRNLLASLGVVISAREVLAYGDAFVQVQNALRITGTATEELAAATRELFDIATRTRTPIEGIAELYQRLSISSRDLGIDQQQLLRFVELVGQSLAVQGGDSRAAAGALLQLSQALGNARIQMQEFNSLADGAPALLRAAAAGIEEAGGSVAKLRQLVIDGEVSNREFFDGIMRGAPLIEDAFARAEITVGSALTNMRSAMIELVGETGNATGATSRLAGAITGLADSMRNPGFKAFVQETLAFIIADLERGIDRLSAMAKIVNELSRQRGQTGGLGAMGMAAGMALGRSEPPAPLLEPRLERPRAGAAIVPIRVTGEAGEVVAATPGKTPGRVATVRNLPPLDEPTITFGTRMQEWQRRLPGRAQPMGPAEGFERVKWAPDPDELERLERQRELLGIVQNAAQDAGSRMSESFADAALSGERLSDVLARLGEDLARMALSTAINVPVQGALQSIFGSVAGTMGLAAGAQFMPRPAATTPGGVPIYVARQAGGTVRPEGWALVGERGPELVRAGTHGATVAPMRASAPAPQISVNVTNEAGPMVNVGKPRVTTAGGRTVINMVVAGAVNDLAASGGMDPLLRNAGVRRRGIARQ